MYFKYNITFERCSDLKKKLLESATLRWQAKKGFRMTHLSKKTWTTFLQGWKSSFAQDWKWTLRILLHSTLRSRKVLKKFLDN